MRRPSARKRWSWRSQAFRGLLWQVVAVLLVGFAVWFLAHNTLENMRARGIQSGFDFLKGPAGFDIGESLIPYDALDPYWKAFLVGILNTLRVAIIGIGVATLFGTLLGIGRFSANAIVRGLCYAYTETFRNVPILLQLLFWYLVFTEVLPPVAEPVSVGPFLLSKAGFSFPWWVEGRWSVPAPGAFSMEGGASATPEFMAVLMGLVFYTSAFIGEIVRAGIAAVPKGQVEAASALGLPRGLQVRKVILPQALRVIIPPLTSQYLNITKNSSLAVAIGYPDVVSIANTSLNNTGRAVECISIIMLVYLVTSLSTALFMNWYNKRVAIQER
ncbi:amino acid ABC transporter permease [Betaproteobacteria bacterium GR16-43]|nr:amino acid ABC transporter permease [Betaproteobacteria bacterium GR16-43]